MPLPPPGRRLLRAALLLLCILPLLSPRAAAGQTPAGGVVSGSIVDAATGTPLANAAVTLEPGEGGALPAPGRGEGGALRASWTARTDSAGRYRFAGVAEGAYRLRVQRIGYRSSTVELVMRGPAESRVSVGLVVQPVALEPVTARAHVPDRAANPFGPRRGEDGGPGSARAAVERARQRDYLAPDVRAVTGADVQEGVTLAETDLFRALQRLPGVAARDEYSAGLWTRGAPWDHTRVYFDGIPLYNPVHSFGLFSGVNADAVGAVFLHPGVQPLSTGGGAAAALDVRSRRGGRDGKTTGVLEGSLASARVAMDGSAGGRHDWMVAARGSNAGWLVRRMERRTEEQDVWDARDFADLAARYDLALSGGAAVEASVLWQTDRVSPGPDADWETGKRPQWGNLAARATLRRPVAGMAARFTVGTSRYDADVRSFDEAPSMRNQLFSWPSLWAARSRLRYVVGQATLEPAADSGGTPPPWSAGAGVVRHSVEYAGPAAYPADALFPPSSYERRGSLSHAFAWGERRWRLAPPLAVEAGMRLDAGGGMENGGALRWSPRAAARLALSPVVTLSAAAGRSYQYVQAGPELGEQAITQHLWLVAGEDYAPVLRSDVATLGAEAWLGGAWLASATAYERRSTGVALLDPRPGDATGRPTFVTGSLHAEGVELSLRRLSGRWTLSGAYSWSVSTTRAEGLRFESPGAPEHTVDLSARAPLGLGAALGAAFTASSGTAFTRFYGGIARCPAGNPPCVWEERPRAGEPGALRGAPYASLDLLLDWSHAFGRWRVGAFAQVHNVLGRENPARYNHSVHYPSCGYGQPDPDGQGCTVDLWSRGLPRFPVAGVRISF